MEIEKVTGRNLLQEIKEIIKDKTNEIEEKLDSNMNLGIYVRQ